MASKWLKLLKRWNFQIQKLYEKVQSPFMIYADFESISVPESQSKAKSRWVLYEQTSKS